VSSNAEECLMAVLLLKSQDGEAIEVPVEGRVLLGRGAQSAVRLRDERVSRQHAEVRAEPHGVFIRDLGSRNGTWVNRRVVHEARLAYGDEIVLGSTRLIFSDRAPSELVGETFGAYRIDCQIGSGGMGVVYRATHSTTGRTVAIKVLHPRLGADRRFVERFLREARAARALSHPNVVRVYESGKADALYYYAMEFIAGSTVAEELRRRGIIDPDPALGIAIEIASALGYAHRQGIIHRDVKPENIMLALTGRAKLADLGLAKFVERRERDVQRGIDGRPRIWGTPAYIAPEAALGRDTDGRSDLYSLGATLFHMLTGQPPFPGGTITEILTLHVHEPLPALQTVSPHLPQNLNEVLEKAMAKQPGRRHQTGEELVADLTTIRSAMRQDMSTRETRPASSFGTPTPPDTPSETSFGD
jgi:serine/threonine protein kinase